MIEIEELGKSYGTRTLWKDVTFSLKSGQLTALSGPSGSGKSTLLNCLGLLDKPSAGAIRHEERDITRLVPGAARRFRRDVLGYLFQNYALVENATIAQNLDIALKVRKRKGATAKAAMAQALERVGLGGRGQDRVSQLSGGEQQRVALARLLVKEPQLVLADEPTGALDRDNTEMVVGVLRQMADAGCAVVIATHDDWVREQCDQLFDVSTSAPASSTTG
ncbi:ATP-binding cassette domain-containing protein [Streptomyces cinereospinus]|uniref:ATP-binding cassette domain-containing protein n=1 Tax=Streptomyces cinereospinus TaxID=285561 RepID=A0ABV5MT34_9ACTN